MVRFLGMDQLIFYDLDLDCLFDLSKMQLFNACFPTICKHALHFCMFNLKVNNCKYLLIVDVQV
jgi:hypothetical protein